MAQYQQQQHYTQPSLEQFLANTPLPSGWEMRMDPSTGWPFFIDHHNQTTSWTDPRKAMYEGNMQHRPGYREIPIMHESGHQGSQSSQQNRQIHGRQIPIQQEQGKNSPSFSRNAPPGNGGWGWQEGYSGQRSAPQNNHSEQQRQHREIPIVRETNQFPSTQQQPPQKGTTTQPNHSASSQNKPAENVHYSSGPQVNTPSAAASAGETKQEQTPPPPPPPAAVPAAGLQPPSVGQQRAASPAPPNLTPLEHIQNIIKETEELQKQVNVFSSTKADKQYLFLEEMLTRKLLKLDNIDSCGNDEIRAERKRGVKLVQGCLDQLELKAFANAQPASGESKNDSKDQQHLNANQKQTDSPANGEQKMDTSSGNQGQTGVKDIVLDSEVNC